MHYHADSIRAMASRRRAAFVNTLSGYKSANLVATASKSGRTNVAIMSSAVHLGSDPALLALVIRPGEEERHTLQNILDTSYYSINHVNSSMVAAAHQSAARYPREVSEFEATGLTPVWHEGFPAPLVGEAPVRIGLRLREHQRLAINDTHLMIGEVVLVEFPDGCEREDGGLDLAATETVALSGLDGYHEVCRPRRMAYAKPDLPPRERQDG